MHHASDLRIWRGEASMPSRPWFKFYPADWQADELLGMCTLAARGLWVEMLGIMHKADPYGHLVVNGRPPTDTQLAALARCPPDQIPGLLDELGNAGVFSRTRTGVIYSRRMTRDERRSKDGRTGKATGDRVPGSRRARAKVCTKPADKGRETAPKSAVSDICQTIDETGVKSATLKVVGKVVAQPPSPQKPESRLSEKAPLSGSQKETARRRQIPVDWLPSPEGRAYAAERAHWPDERIASEAERFRDHHRGLGNRFADLDAAWRTWVRNGAKFDAERGGRLPLNSAATDAYPTDSAEHWRDRLRLWVNPERGGPTRDRWLLHEAAWGPPPGDPGCRAPPDVLREFNLSGVAAE